MPYLTYAEYQEYGEIEEVDFDKLLKRASSLLDNVTSYFYVRNDIQEDDTWRVIRFKQALCSQIEYFAQVGSILVDKTRVNHLLLKKCLCIWKVQAYYMQVLPYGNA